jgi:squalene-hopene/tetraprenyl-beta-curcumene cyclase
MRAPDPTGLARWPMELFPERLWAARSLLRDRLAAKVDSDGAIRSPCASRVLESALGLRLLERTTLLSDAYARLHGYLTAQRQGIDPLDRTLVSAALDGCQQGPGRELAGFLARAPEFTSRRKRLLIDAIFTLFGVPMTGFDPAAFRTDGLHSWARVQVASVKVIALRALDRTAEIAVDDVGLLLSTQNLPAIWEGNVLIHLCVLHALAGLPDTETTVEHGVRQVLRQQRRDGGLPFVTDTDTWCTATGGVALATAGGAQPVLHRIARHLVREQRSDGGWAYTDRAQQTDVDDTCVATEFLHGQSRLGYQRPLEKSLAYLRRIAAPDGGFPTYVPDAPAEACMTAAAINAVGIQEQANRDLIQKGFDFLRSAQRDDGSFDPDWSASAFHTVFRAVLATWRVRASAALVVRQRALDLVHAARNPDGGRATRSALRMR